METENPTKIARTEPGVDADDRLSTLPDEILAHILSFLQTKYAVRTVILSRRWEDVWARVSSLDIDNHYVYKSLHRELADRNMPPYDPQKYMEEERHLGTLESILREIRRLKELDFCRFVDWVLSRHQNLSSLKRFRFHFKVPWREKDQARPDFLFERESVLGPLLEEMEIKLLGMAGIGLTKYMGCLPQSFNTLKNLTVAKLERVIIMNAAEESVLLPNLKILELTHVRVTNFESLTRFISGCPALETAHLENCVPSERNENDILDVSLPSLKKLKIIDRDYSSGNEACPVVIRAPNLEHLYFEVSAKLRFMGSTPLPCLHSAHVEVGKSLDHSLIGFFTIISNAKKMSLTRETLCHLSRLTDVQLPVFPNLTHLTLGTDCDIWVLHSLLNSATKLHSLVIDLEDCYDLMNWDWRQADSRPECLLSSLEEIVIENLVAGEDEMSIVAYLLATGAVLEKVKMHLNVNYLYMLGRESRGSLLKLSRRSSACKVELFPHEEE